MFYLNSHLSSSFNYPQWLMHADKFLFLALGRKCVIFTKPLRLQKSPQKKLEIYGWNVLDSDNRQSQWHCKSPTGNETPTKVLDCFYESSHKHFNKMIQCPQIITWFKYEWNAGDSFKMQEFRRRVIIPRSGFSLFCGSIRASSIHFLFLY